MLSRFRPPPCKPKKRKSLKKYMFTRFRLPLCKPDAVSLSSQGSFSLLGASLPFWTVSGLARGGSRKCSQIALFKIPRARFRSLAPPGRIGQFLGLPAAASEHAPRWRILSSQGSFSVLGASWPFWVISGLARGSSRTCSQIAVF